MGMYVSDQNRPKLQSAAISAPVSPTTSDQINALKVAIPDANAPLPTRLQGPGPNNAVYDSQRKIATDAAQAAGAQGIDAITRRYAAMGNLNSGAYTQALADSSRNTQEATERAMSGIDSNQNQMNQQESQFNRSLGENESQFGRSLAMGQNQQILDQWANEVNAQTAAKQSGGGGGGCCFIFLEARYGNGVMDKVVRRYREEYMTEGNRRGYYKLAEVLVPLMRKSNLIKFAVRIAMTDPLVSYGKWYYGENKLGWIFAPIKTFWLKMFEYLGGNHEFVRENGEVV